MELIVATEYQLARLGGKLITDPKNGGKVIRKDQVITKSYFDRINDNTHSCGRLCVKSESKTKKMQDEAIKRRELAIELKESSATIAKSNLASKLLEDLAKSAISEAKGGNDDK